MDNKVEIFDKAWRWIEEYTIDGNGIAITSKQQVIYPEVTGYYIPTLLMWGNRRLAIAYAKYLCDIQNEDGSWYGSDYKESYVFDTAQILKGLIAIRGVIKGKEVDLCIVKGCDWILSNMQENGRLTTPSKNAWGNNENFCSELVHIYCLSPIRDAGKLYRRTDYIEAVDKILSYYKHEKMEQIINFSLLSHFYAYVVEGLCDLGEVELAFKCMKNIEKYQNRKGGIAGLKDVYWTCSTSMFQLALVWYKLGVLEKGNKIFYYACSLQNKSGGWYGSYPISSFVYKGFRKKNKPYYFPNEEISWANKYFLDALALKEQLEFEKMAPIFMENIAQTDGRNEYYAMDLSEQVMHEITCVKDKRTGRLTQIPYENSFFDLVYVCEALEHAINLEGAFKELYRIIKSGGKFIIIDKPLDKLGEIEIYEWEQWISDDAMQKFTDECGGKLEIIKSIPYEDKDDGLFRAWIVTKY